jgi:glycosyltransferase involved in cell wall biosynthesis
VTVLTTDPSGELPAVERTDEVEVRRLSAHPRRSDYYLTPGLGRAIAGGEWDVVHVHSYHTFVAPAAMLAARRARLPYVLTFHAGGHSSPLRRSVRPAQRRALGPLLGGARRLVALTVTEAERWQRQLRLPASRFTVIPNGCDLPLTGLRPASRREPLIASIGRLERYKGHQRVIGALPYVLEAQPAARLWIAGSGPYEGALRRLAARLGVAERVDIHSVPAGERERMARELGRVAVAALLSDFETQPLAILEAAALGCPSVVADAPGLRELAAAGIAHAVPARASAREIADALLEQMRRPRAAAVSLPTWEDCARNTLALYEEVACAY